MYATNSSDACGLLPRFERRPLAAFPDCLGGARTSTASGTAATRQQECLFELAPAAFTADAAASPIELAAGGAPLPEGLPPRLQKLRSPPYDQGLHNLRKWEFDLYAI